MRVLIAEDNLDNLDMLTRRLERRGFQIVSAGDGQQAVEAALRERPDLILMDVSMPVMSGIEATKAIRANPAVADLPIIALTAHAMDGDRTRCLEAGCDAYATKPVDLPALLAAIEHVMSAKGRAVA
jgi:CheY-like chemotaxis protein